MSSSSVTLPSVSGSVPSEESEVELPDTSEPCCTKNCVERVNRDPWLANARSRLLENVEKLDLPAQNALWFNQLLQMEHPHGGRRGLTWHGVELCQKGYSAVSGCPVKKIRLYLQHVKEGYVKPPQDARHVPLKKEEPKRADVESFFVHLWHHFAEPLGLTQDGGNTSADADDSRSTQGAEVAHPGRGQVLVPTWLSEVLPEEALEHPDGKITKRWLPPMTNSELFDLYKDLHNGHESLASWSTFCRVWKRWQAILAFRPQQTHARCDDCSKYSKFRKIHENSSQLKAVNEAYARHVKDVFADRFIITSMETAAEQAFRTDGMELPHIFLSIDAMDKAKWQVPRQLENTKKLSLLWKPSLHLVGVLIAGVLEYFAVLEADQKGDSDCQQTIVARALEHAENVLREHGKSMPRRLILHFDNTSKEGRNSMLLRFAAALVSSGRMDEVSLALYRVGHTHNRLDQRFGSMGFQLARAECLQSPSEYVAYLQENYKPSRHVRLIIEEVVGIYSWRTFFEPLEIHYTGMTGTKTTADAAHCMRVVRRDMVASCVQGINFTESEGRGADPVLLAKHWLCSKKLSQPPTVLLQGPLPIQWGDLKKFVAERTRLNEESLKQYTRTAQEILSPPWKMETAFSYLHSWMNRNRNKNDGQPPDLPFIMSGRGFLPAPGPAADSVEETWKDFAPQGAVEIRPVPKRVLRRPAASSASTRPQFSQVSRGHQARRNLAMDLKENDPAMAATFDEAGAHENGSRQPGTPDEAASDPDDSDDNGGLPHPSPAPAAPEASVPDDGQEDRPRTAGLRRPAAAPGSHRGMRRPAAAMEAPSEGRPAARQRVEQLQWEDERVQAIVASWPNGRTPGLGCPKCRMKAHGCKQCKLWKARAEIATAGN